MANQVNTGLLRRIADRIEHEPQRYDQGLWGTEHGVGFFGGDARSPPGCGSAACVLGWAAALGPSRPPDRCRTADIYAAGVAALGLDQSAATRLSNVSWPAEWFRAAGLTPAAPRVSPAPREAVAILRAMADAEDARVHGGGPGWPWWPWVASQT